ncbi:O-fucosyltransferase family protein [Desertihabitans brevis]|uniref:hypothetical protein n=1 Tax=Desertihabitans brevis TaxID=2268447 RepID=UPI0013143AEF|nr:hypothetical protein [Desertihabitans brevis]
MVRGGRRYVIAVCRPHHGLGNRMRVVFGARALARSTGRELRYVWPVGRPFGARLDELWQVPERPVPSVLSHALRLRFPYRGERLDWVAGAGAEPVWQIRTAHALHLPEDAGPWERELQQVLPVPAIQEAVRDFHAEHLDGRPYVGVMVRAHAVSHQETLRASPVEWYLDRLTALRREHPGLRFFLSSDTTEAAERISAAVPGCVRLGKSGGYNTRQGLHEAVTDLYLLAGSCHLVGPHYSSFPELAQRLAGPGLRLETSRTPADARFEAGPLTTAPDCIRPHRREPARL